jgi:hypothetical protein
MNVASFGPDATAQRRIRLDSISVNETCSRPHGVFVILAVEIDAADYVASTVDQVGSIVIHGMIWGPPQHHVEHSAREAGQSAEDAATA